MKSCLLLFFALFSIPTGLVAADETAIFAGGCFWCMQPPFDQTPGVSSTQVGYIGGTKPNPTYEAVSSGKTKYREAIKIKFNPKKISYAQLLQVFWRNVDPTDDQGQFCDKGNQYRSAIYFLNDQQKKEATDSANQIKKTFGIPVYTKIEKANSFYPAEGYHQNYYQKNPLRYRFYRFSCGRDRRLKAIWKNA